MPRQRVRAATRASALARWQTDHVARLLAATGLDVDVVAVDTEGDRRRDVAISDLGGKGVFAKEVQEAVLDGRADLAVHSAKDLPSVTVDGLTLAAVPERADPRDALVGARLADLRPGARVGTGSNRRRVQLASARPGLVFAELRGNMHTRLAKAKEFDAIVVAVAAFERLDLTEHLTEILDPALMVPQVGQGALAVECRADDTDLREVLSAIEHAESRWRVDAERSFLAELGGDCDLPAGALAVPDAGGLRLDAVLASPDGFRMVRHHQSSTDAGTLGVEVARRVRAELDRPA